MAPAVAFEVTQVLTMLFAEEDWFMIPVDADAMPEVFCTSAAETVPAVSVVFAAVNRAAVVPSPSSQPPEHPVIVVPTRATTPSMTPFAGMQLEQSVVVAPEVERFTSPESVSHWIFPPP